jgi:FkbM family methyltransferase
MTPRCSPWDLGADVTTTRSVLTLQRNGRRFRVEYGRGPKGGVRTLQYYVQRLAVPSQRRLYRFYNRAVPGFWRGLARGEFEPETFRVFDAFLDPDHTYIDIGAWIGPTVLYGAQLAKHCYAIEPDPVAYRLLETNVGLNPEFGGKITLFRGCIASVCGTIRLGNRSSPVGGDSRSSLLMSGAPQGWEVRSTTLQRFMEDHRVGDCNFIKMDVEGGEAVILPSLAPLLGPAKPTLYLSLHPFLFARPDEEMRRILDLLGPYRHLLDKTGKPIGPTDLLATDRVAPCECIIATDRLPRGMG